ncbi:hypothetical protein [Streptomyces sp. NPDC058247]|uniref:hypothetical protein n=1 Tax=Streptomyces sp. NPDC058247 TaxID=3346401 RepID=UPI0036E31AC1
MTAQAAEGAAYHHAAGATRLPAGRPWDVVAIPRPLGEAVLHTLEALFSYERPPAVVDDPVHSRAYFITEPGQGGIWGEDIWTLDAGSWLTFSHSPSARPLPVADLRRALHLAYPAFRWRTAGIPPQQLNPGGIL